MQPLEANGVRVAEIMDGPVRCPVAPMVPFADHVFPTPSGRYEFLTDMEFQPGRKADFPLTFVTNFSKRWLLSQMTEADHPKTAAVRVGPDAAAAAGVRDGDMAMLRSAVGALKVEVRVDARVGADIVLMPVGTWIKRGGGANVLTEDILTNFGQMAAFGDTRVRLEALPPPARQGAAPAETAMALLPG
jgi:anaerobic selenocysteine-containing dehydrogenase